MHKVFFIDCDGTLLQKDGSITKEDKAAIQQALDKHHTVVLTSGRPYHFLQELIEKLDPRLKSISFNGAKVEDTVLGYLDEASIENLLRLESKAILFKGVEAYYTPNKKIPEDFMYSKAYPLKELEAMNPKKIIKCLIYKWHGLIHLEDVSLYQYQDKGYEILPKNTSKGLAIQNYLKKYQTSPYTVSIGDDVNDVSMFHTTNRAYLMSHSTLDILNVQRCASVKEAIFNEIKEEGEI